MSEMSKAWLTAVVILLALILYCFGTRYQMVPTGFYGKAYLVNRVTGEVWIYEENKYLPTEPARQPAP
jgi:hypothetical protein